MGDAEAPEGVLEFAHRIAGVIAGFGRESGFGKRVVCDG